jgi:hypothetical protein
MNLKQVKSEIDFLLNKAINSDDSLRVGTSFRYASDSYRIRSELPIDIDKDKVVLNRLKRDPKIESAICLNEISKDREGLLINRLVFRELRNWSYRYGSTGRSVNDMEVPDFRDTTNKVDKIIDQFNDRITSSGGLTVNDACLAMGLAGEICDRYGLETIDEGIFESRTYNQVQEILNQCVCYIDNKDEKNLNWDQVAKTFGGIRDQSHQDLMETVGKKSVIRSLKNFEGDSIEEFLTQNK